MKADDILKKHEDANEMHFHEVDRKWIIEEMEEYAALRQPHVSGSVSFPKGRPKCCGRGMYAAGGTVGNIDENSVRYWRCDVCKQEVTDLAS